MTSVARTALDADSPRKRRAGPPKRMNELTQSARVGTGVKGALTRFRLGLPGSDP